MATLRDALEARDIKPALLTEILDADCPHEAGVPAAGNAIGLQVTDGAGAPTPYGVVPQTVIIIKINHWVAGDAGE